MGNSRDFCPRHAIERVKAAAMELRHAIRDAVEGPLDHTSRRDLAGVAKSNLDAIIGLLERNCEMLGAFGDVDPETAPRAFHQEESR